MIYGYIRVSSDKQTVENQRYEITQFCRQQGIGINGWIEETISGVCHYKQRRLGHLLHRVEKGDIIICSELSRLGRTLFMIMDILNLCMQRGCEVWTIKDNYRLGEDLQSKVLAFAFGLSAEIERTLLSQRTREALARRRAEGVHIGRSKGSRNKRHKLTGKEAYIQRQMAAGVSLETIALRLHVHRTTIQRHMAVYKPLEPPSVT